MSKSSSGPTSPAGSTGRSVKVLVVGSVLFSFISYWRTAAIVLCDLASTSYYIGGIVEQAIGPAAPWFILAVLLFSWLVRDVYLESCSLFVRGGVYRVVKEAMGSLPAKLSVSALLFDFVLTGPISAVSAGQYLLGLAVKLWEVAGGAAFGAFETPFKAYGSVLIAIAVTAYFWWENIKGIHESSDKALKIMQATGVVMIIMFIWCGVTLAVRGPTNPIPSAAPDLNPKMNYDIGEVQAPLGFLEKTETGKSLREMHNIARMKELAGKAVIGPLSPEETAEVEHEKHTSWLSMLGLTGILIAFGHSVLAMSGEETLAQVYREVESPKMKNMFKAAIVVFIFSVIVTPGICFFASVIIPDEVRMRDYSSNLISGLAMNMVGPDWAKLTLNALVVVVGFVILSGAVNTSMIGSNGVLNRVAEDGVIPIWFLKPHHRFGTNYRMLNLIAILQLITILASRGDVITLGEAYAFGVVWSFTFKAAAMVVLRFTNKSPREHRVPFNLPLGNGRELPLGLIGIFLLLASTATMNLLTKPTATIWGIGFSLAFLATFVITEKVYQHRRQLAGEGKAHFMEQFNRETPEALTAGAVGVTLPFRKIVAIRSTQNLHMLERALGEADPHTTDVVVVTCKVLPTGDSPPDTEMDVYDQQLMTAVVTRAETAGKHVIPMILPTNNPLHAILTVARELEAQELIMGASNKFTAEEQLDQVALYWMSLKGPMDRPMTVRVEGKNFHTHIDLDGGNRIPTIRERQAKSVDELRAAGIGVQRALLLHDGSQSSGDLFDSVLTMLDDDVKLGIALPPAGAKVESPPEESLQRAASVGRVMQQHPGAANASVEELVQLVRENKYDLILIPCPAEGRLDSLCERTRRIFQEAPCVVSLVTPASIPKTVET